MNASIYVVFKDGEYQLSCGSLRSVVTNVNEMEAKVEVADIRKEVKADKIFSVTADNGSLIQVSKDLLL